MTYEIESTAYAVNDVFYFYEVPIFYTPIAGWSTRSGRASGFLPPQISASFSTDPARNNGYTLKIPYYLNISDQADYTIALDFIERRGVAFDNVFRYLGEDFIKGGLQFWYLDENTTRSVEESGPRIGGNRKPSRYFLDFYHKQIPSEYFDFLIDIYRQSDNEVRNDYFSSNYERDYLEQNLFEYTVKWTNGKIGFLVEKDIRFAEASEDLNRQPQIELTQFWNNVAGSGFNFKLKSQWTNYERIEGLKGTRQIYSIQMTQNFGNSFFHFVPELEIKNHIYSIKEATRDEISIDDREFQLTYYRFKLETDLIFEKQTVGKEGVDYWTFRPFLVYEKIPDLDQRKTLFLKNQLINQLSLKYTDYYDSDPIFDSADRVLSKEAITLGLEWIYYKKKESNNRAKFFSFTVEGVYDLHYQTTTTDYLTQNRGPIIPLEIRENFMSLEQNFLPIKTTITLHPQPDLDFILFNRYDVFASELLETNFATSWRYDDSNQLTLNYKNNRFEYIDLDDNRNFAGHFLDIIQKHWFNENYFVQSNIEWNFDEIDSNTSSQADYGLVMLGAQFAYQTCCYRIGLGYNRNLRQQSKNNETDIFYDESYKLLFEIL